MKTVKVIECCAFLERDRTSYGHQWSLDSLEINNHNVIEELGKFENKRVFVRIEIETIDDGTVIKE